MKRRIVYTVLAALSLTAAPGAWADDDFDDLQEQAVKAAVRRVAPCVVQIETSGGTEVMRAGPTGLIRRGVGPTSGLVVGADGYIISSAFNFANKPSAIRVAVPGHKDRYVAKVVATDQTRMLTLLKIEPEGNARLPVPEPAPKAGVRIGHTAIAVGRTLAPTVESPPSVSVGIVSALDRIWGKAMQTDAKVSPTNYGGPLIDLQGRVLGVLVPASPRADSETAGFEWYDSGIGFAIPLEDVNRVLPRMKAGTEKEPVVLKRGMLGVTMRQDQDPYGAPAVVASVSPGSAAEKSGIKAGDTITAIDGKPIANQTQVHHHLGGRYEGDVVSVKLLRGKDTVTLDKVTLSGAVAAFGQSFLGILPIRDDPEPGVEVRFVFPKSPAEKAGLKAGDRILKVGRPVAPGGPVMQQPVPGRDQLMALLEAMPPGMDLQLEVKRKAGGKTENLSVKLGEMPDLVPEKLPENASAKKARGKAAAKEEKKDKEEKKLETGLLKRTTAAGDHSYWVFVPDNYDPNVAHGLVVWLHPVGKNKDRDIDRFLDAWQWDCEDYHLIMVIPKTENERGWTQGEAEFVLETVKAVTDAYTVDRQRVVAHGMGLGGEMAFYLGFHARNVVRGVATTGAALTSNPREKVPNQPLSFFLVVGGKDPLRDAVKDSRAKLAEHKYPVIYREVEDMGHQYIDGRAGRKTMDEMIRWIDALDRM
jgi:S1-C subfamily serine protease/poly(3-hydroxybutyrate) depolymerase